MADCKAAHSNRAGMDKHAGGRCTGNEYCKLNGQNPPNRGCLAAPVRPIILQQYSVIRAFAAPRSPRLTTVCCLQPVLEKESLHECAGLASLSVRFYGRVSLSVSPVDDG